MLIVHLHITRSLTLKPFLNRIKKWFQDPTLVTSLRFLVGTDSGKPATKWGYTISHKIGKYFLSLKKQLNQTLKIESSNGESKLSY